MTTVVRSVATAVVRSPASTRIVRGAQGPMGPTGTGGGVADFVFTQGSAATPWIVNHNLGRKPLVAVLDAGGNEVEAEVQHVSTNQLRIYFAAPQPGSARCI